MAFISLVLVFLVAIAIILIVGIVPIVIGTILYHKTSHKKLGIALRVFGYIILIPVIVIAVLAALAMFNLF